VLTLHSVAEDLVGSNVDASGLKLPEAGDYSFY
jgi:hypothetical protein